MSHEHNITGTSEEAYPSKRAYFQPKLAKFLKEEGVYKEAVEATKSEEQERWNNSLAGAFSWIDTAQGHSFWSKLNKKYEGRI